MLVLNLLSPSPDLGSLDCRILTLSSQGPFGYVRYVMGYGSWSLVCSSSKAAIRRQPTELSLSSSVNSLHLTTFNLFAESLLAISHILFDTRSSQSGRSWPNDGFSPRLFFDTNFDNSSSLSRFNPRDVLHRIRSHTRRPLQV